MRKNVNYLILISGILGQFLNGYMLGIVGPVIPCLYKYSGTNIFWNALIGSASIYGLAIGSFLSGPFIDKYGRSLALKSVFFAYFIISISYFVFLSKEYIFISRLFLGFFIGVEYVVSKTYANECLDKKIKSKFITIIGLFWMVGISFSYIFGTAVVKNHEILWNYLLVFPAIISIVGIFIRSFLNESLEWKESHLTSQIAQKHLEKISFLFKKGMFIRTLVATSIYSCHNVPFFAINTYLPSVLSNIFDKNSMINGIFYNIVLTIGSVASVISIAFLKRRSLVLYSLFLQSLFLLISSFSFMISPYATLISLSLFALVLSGSSGVDFVYIPELFPTTLRGTGIGFTICLSRIITSFCTFLFPYIIQKFGINVSLSFIAVLVFLGYILCLFYAPETQPADVSGKSAQPRAG